MDKKQEILYQKIEDINSETTKSEYFKLLNEIKNVYNYQTFETIYNNKTYKKLYLYKTKQDARISNQKISKDMLERYNQTMGLKIEINFKEFDRVKNKNNALRLIFVLVTLSIIIPILVFASVIPKRIGVLFWGISMIIISIVALFFLYIKDKNKPKFCFKDADGFEECIEASENERHYKYLPNKKENDFSEKAEIVKKMSEKEKTKCRKWEAVKNEFDFNVDCKEARCNILSGTDLSDSSDNKQCT